MPRSKEISEDPRLRIVDLHKSGKGYRSISKRPIRPWRKFSPVATLPTSGHPARMTARAQRRMLNEVKKNPRVSAKD